MIPLLLVAAGAVLAAILFTGSSPRHDRAASRVLHMQREAVAKAELAAQRERRAIQWSPIGWRSGPCPHKTGDHYYSTVDGALIRSQARSETARLITVLRDGEIEDEAPAAIEQTEECVANGAWTRVA